MLPGTQKPIGPPPMTPGEVGAAPSTRGDIPAGLLIDGMLPVIGAGPTPGVAPNVPIVPYGVPGAVLPPIDEPPLPNSGVVPNEL